MVYTRPEIRELLGSQPDDVQCWLTTSQMGWALTRERNEIANEKDKRDGKPVARQLAPMISKFIRVKWESHDLECMDDERRQIHEEAAELDHIWGCCLLLQYLIQSCARGGRRIVEDMCYEIRRAEACVD